MSHIPPKTHSAFVRLSGVVPGGYDGLIGVYTQNLFRPTKVVFRRCPGVCAFVAGMRVDFDDDEHELDNSYTLSVGAFIAFHVKNDNALSRHIELEVTGRAPEPGEVGRGFMTGFLTPTAPADGAA